MSLFIDKYAHVTRKITINQETVKTNKRLVRVLESKINI